MWSRLASVLAPRGHHPWVGYAVGVVAVALTTPLVLLLEWWFGSANGAMPYLVAVLLAAGLYGRGPGILAALLAVLSYDFIFVQPSSRWESVPLKRR